MSSTFLKCAQEFFVEATSQIRNHFPIGDPVIKMLQVLDPNTSHSKFPSLVPLAPIWYPSLNYSSLIMNGVSCLLFPYPLIVRIWIQRYFGEGFIRILMALELCSLCKFMQLLLCLPHGNVDVERVFSAVNLIKTKSRNRLHTKTVGALLKVKHGVAAAGGCVVFSPPTGANWEWELTSCMLQTQILIKSSCFIIIIIALLIFMNFLWTKHFFCMNN